MKVTPDDLKELMSLIFQVRGTKIRKALFVDGQKSESTI